VHQPPAPKSDGCDVPDVLTRLLTPTVRVLVEADEAISRSLRKDALNPCAHEAAAVLLGAFQLREAWSVFADPRPSLDGMAAHLAIAHAVRSGAVPGPEGRIADLMLRALAWRHDGFPEALRRAASTASPAERTWLRVISLYSVQDWRELARPAGAWPT
jgi:hypothetical protein